MREPKVGAASECSCDADILTEIAAALQDSACLYHALTELIGDAQQKALAAQSSALRTALSAQLRSRSVNVGELCIRDADHVALSNHAPALQALARADHANARRHIELCDAEAMRLIGQHCDMAGLSTETHNLLHLVHRILRQTSLAQIMAGGPRKSPP